MSYLIITNYYLNQEYYDELFFGELLFCLLHQEL